MAFRVYAVLALAFFLCAAHASSFSSVIVYGDSLSDNGNLYKLIGYPPAPYYQGRFSNGPVAVEQLASSLAAPLQDFAYGGATTGVGNYIDFGTQTRAGLLGLPGMQQEFAASLPLLSPALISHSLFVIWGGANDYFAGGSAATASADVDSFVQQLESDGATHILVPGMPDLSLTPEFYEDPTARDYSLAFNQLLQAGLPGGATYFDTYGLLHQVVADPSAFGLSNVTQPCFSGFTVCSDPNAYLFWDHVHPSTATDAILAREFAGAVAPTPEPGSLLLTLSGLSGMGTLVYRRHLSRP